MSRNVLFWYCLTAVLIEHDFYACLCHSVSSWTNGQSKNRMVAVQIHFQNIEETSCQIILKYNEQHYSAKISNSVFSVRKNNFCWIVLLKKIFYWASLYVMFCLWMCQPSEQTILWINCYLYYSATILLHLNYLQLTTTLA